MTAAHCVDRYQDWTVHLGAQNIKDTAEPGRVTIVSTKGTIHENYDSSEITNDIGLVNLPKDVQFTGKFSLSIN